MCVCACFDKVKKIHLHIKHERNHEKRRRKKAFDHICEVKMYNVCQIHMEIHFLEQIQSNNSCNSNIWQATRGECMPVKMDRLAFSQMGNKRRRVCCQYGGRETKGSQPAQMHGCLYSFTITRSLISGRRQHVLIPGVKTISAVSSHVWTQGAEA